MERVPYKFNANSAYGFLVLSIGSLLMMACHPRNTNATATGTVATDSLTAKNDTDTYAHLPYRNSETNLSGMAGYKDTITIAGNHFRLIHEDDLYGAVIEKNMQGKWIENFETEMGNHNSYSFEDVNNDGYKDFVHGWK